MGTSSINGPFSMAMLNNQRVVGKINGGTSRKRKEMSGLMLALAVSISWRVSHEFGTPDANFMG